MIRSFDTRTAILLLAKLAIATGLLWWTFCSLEYGALLASVRRMTPGSLLAALGLQWVAYFFGAFRWWLMLAHSRKDMRLRDVQGPYYMGLFFNQFLPSSVGGDAVRIGTMYRHGVPGNVLVSSSLMDRVIGLIVLLWLGLIASSWTDAIKFPAQVRHGILVCSIIVPLLGAVLFLPVTESLLRKLWPRSQFRRVSTLLFNVLATCRSYGKSPRLVLTVLLASVLLQLSATSVYLVLGTGLGIDLALTTYIAVISIVYISATLPISLGGLGVRENVFVSLMVFAGAGRLEAAALALAFLGVLWISVLPGLCYFVLCRGAGHLKNVKPGPGVSEDAEPKHRIESSLESIS